MADLVVSHFAELYKGAYKLIRNYIEFEPLLGDLETTLKALHPLIQKIKVQNTELSLPSEAIEKLKKDIEEGLNLVHRISEAGVMVGCFTKPTTYTSQIRDLDTSLRRQLEILQAHQVWVENETLMLVRYMAKRMDEKDGHSNIQNDLVCTPFNIDFVLPVSIDEPLINQNDAELVEIKPPMSSPVHVFGGAGSGLLLDVLHGSLEGLIGKSTIYKPRIKSIISELHSLEPLISEIEESDKELDLPKDAVVEEFESHMEEGILIVRKCSKVPKWNLLGQYKFASKLLEWEKSNHRVMQKLIHLLQRKQAVKLQELVERLSIPGESPYTENMEGCCAVPELPSFIVGLGVPLMELKTKLLEDDQVSMLVLTAPGGCGKTTLATLFCKDIEVKGIFKNNIYFVFVSPKTNWDHIVKQLYQQKGLQAPPFQNEVHAVELLLKFVKEEGQKPLLLVLDNVWSRSEYLLDKFQFEMPNCKILVTSRFKYPRFGYQYQLPTLNYEDATILFHHNSASLDNKNSHIPADLSSKIVESCKGFPLAIAVVGRSLCGQPIELWRSRIIEWSSKGSSILDSETPLLLCLNSSLDALDKERSVIKECFLDLGSFPEGQRIPVGALIDMWAGLYDLDEDTLCIANLYELTAHNLANLVVTRKENLCDGYYTADFVTQYELLRQLAIYHAKLGPIARRDRLIIDICGDNLPKWWREQKCQPMSARLLSITTDEMFSRKWPNMQLPEAEVLVLNFQTKSYVLPEFVEKMDKLKVLLVTSYGVLPAGLSNFQLLGSLSILRRIRLERISIPSITKNPIQLKSVRKISLFMCSIGQAFSNSSLQISNAFPYLEELNIDHCTDLVELPADLCDLISLKKLCITNCGMLSALPEDIGNLVDLEVLRVRSCTNLVKVPGSIKNLNKLICLDIPDQIVIKELPEDSGEMASLEKLNMTHCSGLTELPPSNLVLEQSNEVICDHEANYPEELILPCLESIHTVVDNEIMNLRVQGTREVNENSVSLKNSEKVISQVEAKFGIKNLSEIGACCAVPPLTVGIDVPGKGLQRKLLNYANEDSANTRTVETVLSSADDEVSFPVKTATASPMEIPNLRTELSGRVSSLRQPQMAAQNKMKRPAHKTQFSDGPTQLSPSSNSSSHSQLLQSSTNSVITIQLRRDQCSRDESLVDGNVTVPVDLLRYEKEDSSRLSSVGMQDLYQAMQRFHVTSTRLVQSEERVALLETSLQKAEDSWKLEHRKLSEEHNVTVVQLAELTREKDSLAERICHLEKNEKTIRQEAQQDLRNTWLPQLKQQMQEAEMEYFEHGCKVGFKSFMAKVGSKLPNLDLSDISQFEPIEFDVNVMDEILGTDQYNEADNGTEGTVNNDDNNQDSDASDHLRSTDQEGPEQPSKVECGHNVI